LFGLPFNPSKADKTWKGGDELEAMGRQWKVFHTPGHSPGSCCIVCDAENLLLGGDLLICGSIGRTDLPGGDEDQMSESLRGLFEDWGKDAWRVYGGHCGPSTIGRERASNMDARYMMSRVC
jgi:glyoxylase-like metal-dependent hydrolase (beta-lactamase superfamily II)